MNLTFFVALSSFVGTDSRWSTSKVVHTELFADRGALFREEQQLEAAYSPA